MSVAAVGWEARKTFDPRLAGERTQADRQTRRAELIEGLILNGCSDFGIQGVLGSDPIGWTIDALNFLPQKLHEAWRSSAQAVEERETGRVKLHELADAVQEVGYRDVAHRYVDNLKGRRLDSLIAQATAARNGATIQEAAPGLEQTINIAVGLSMIAAGVVGPGPVQRLAEGDQRGSDHQPSGPEWKLPAKVAIALGFFSQVLAACREWLSGQTPQLPTVEVTNVTVTPDASETPTPTETPVPPTPEVFLGVSSIDQISAVPGIPAGFGGPGGQELVRNTAEFQAHLNESGFAPVVNEEGVVASILSLDGDRLCVGNTPEKLFNPNTASGEDTLLRSEAGVFQFGDAATGEVRVQVLSAVPLTGLPDHLTCVEAVVVDPKNPAGLGALRMLLVDRTTNSIVGEMPAAFPGSDTVEIMWTDDAPMVRVNGKELHFQFRPEFVTATPEPTETSTPIPETPADRAQRFCEENKEEIAKFVDREFLGKFIKPDTYNNDGSYDFSLIFDGEFDVRRIPLTTKGGEKFGDAIMSMNACYQDKEGQPRTILMPLVVHLVDGRLIFWGFSDGGVYSGVDAAALVSDWASRLPSAKRWVKGAVIMGDFTLDADEYYSRGGNSYDAWHKPILDAYQKGREEDIEFFLKGDGRSNLSLMMPVKMSIDVGFIVPGLK